MFDKKNYIKYNISMKNMLIIDNIIATIAVNWTMCLMFCSLILFRTQILEFVDRGACIINYTFKSFASFVAIVLITVLSAISYLGQSGGTSVANYAINHIYPSLYLMFLEFATFLLMIFNYFLHFQNKGNRILEREVSIKSETTKEYILLFKKPSLALLQ